MQQSLPTASKKFVDFCIGRMPHLVALTRYERSNTHADREMSELVCDRARSLSRLLLDPPRLTEQRRRALAQGGSEAPPPPTPNNTNPFPTPPTSSVQPKKPLPTTSWPVRSSLSTPDSTPPDQLFKLLTSDGLKGSWR